MSSDQKNLYESLIQDMILNGINGMTPELKSLIEKSPVEKQRSMILTVLEENNVEHRLLCSKIYKTIENADSTEATHIKNVVQMLREYVKVSKTEVKTMGEVMTPIELVEEMLDTLPVDVWSNPNLKWLEPANGVGTFVSVIVERLMNGLKTFEPNDKKRYKHIIEQMIYVCELQAKNMFLFMYAFDPKDEYTLNVYNGSFLTEGFDKHMKEVCGVDKFDVVVMNPPYQELKPGYKKSQALWDKFVIKVIENSLIEGGYLVAVHPDSWRTLGEGFTKVKELLKSKSILFVKLFDEGMGIKTFGYSTAFDFYCLKNESNKGNIISIIKCMDEKTLRVNISKLDFIPNGMFDEFKKLLAKQGEEKVEIIMNSSYHTQRTEQMSETKTAEFKYPVVYVTYKDGSINTWYSNVNNKGHFGIPKVIWSNGSATTPFEDINGEYGLSQFAYAIIDKPENLKNIQKAMLNPKFVKMMAFSDGKSGPGRQNRFNRRVIALFRKDFWVDFLDYDETAVAEEKKKPAKSGKTKVVKKSKKETSN